MTRRKLLTIAIPTFNRDIYLEKLLFNLHKEILTITDQLSIIVSNNASTDNTNTVLRKYQLLIPNIIIINNNENLGSDENFS